MLHRRLRRRAVLLGARRHCGGGECPPGCAGGGRVHIDGRVTLVRSFHLAGLESGYARTRRAQHRAFAERRAPGADPCAVSVGQGHVQPELRADRHHHLHLPAHRLRAAAAGGRIHRPSAATSIAGVRHGVHARGTGVVRARDAVFHPRVRRRAYRHGLGHLPSGSLTAGAPRVRRPAWLRPVALPGGRQPRELARAALRRARDRAARAGSSAVVGALRSAASSCSPGWAAGIGAVSIRRAAAPCGSPRHGPSRPCRRVASCSPCRSWRR